LVWDASKSPGDLITSSDWNDMVSDQKNHSSRHSDGGSDELDAADLAGSSGTSGQLLQTDGSAASWVDFSSGASVSDDGSQVLAQPDDVNYANALSATDDGDGTVTVDVESNSIQTSELDLSISPTWTGTHTFNNALLKPQDSGSSTLANMAVSSTPSQGVEQSIGIDIDNTRIFKAYAEADGAGGIQQAALDMSTNDIQNVGNINGVDITSHSSRHEDGGSDELDAGNLDGSSGSSGQVLRTDGNSASWSDAGRQTVDSNKVLQQTLKFGSEGSSTTSTSFVTIQDSDIAVDFDTFKDSSGNVFVKAKYHMRNSSPRAADGTSNSISADYNDASYSTNNSEARAVTNTGDIESYDFGGNSGSPISSANTYTLTQATNIQLESQSISNSNGLTIPENALSGPDKLYTCSGSTVQSYDLPEEVLFRASTLNSFDASGQTSSAEDITWNNDSADTDGDKFYIVSSGDSTVYSYTASTNYDITTLSTANSFDTSGQDSDPSGIAFNSDGTKMFIAGRSSSTIYSYTLSTGFDITTTSTANTLDVSSDVGTVSDISWDNDGSQLYVSDSANSDIVFYSCSTNYDISTASLNTTASAPIAVEGFQFHNDGYFRIYVGGGTAVQESIGSGNPGDQPGITYVDSSSLHFVYSPSQAIIYENDSGGQLVDFYDVKSILGIADFGALTNDGNNLFAVPRQTSSPTTFYELSVGSSSITQVTTYDVSYSSGSLNGIFYDSSNGVFFTFDSGSQDAVELDSSFNKTGFTFDISSLVDDGGSGSASQRSHFGYYDPDTDVYIVSDDVENTTNDTLASFEASPGQAFARIFRQNDGTVVSGTQAGGDAGDVWNFFETGWIDLSSESGNESYQIQLSTGDRGEAFYNSMVLHIATPE